MRTLAKLIGISVIALAAYSQAPETTEQPSTLVVEVVRHFGEETAIPGYAGRTVPLPDKPVYLFRWQESGWIRDWTRKLERDIQASNEDPNDSDKHWIVEKRLQDLYKMVSETKSFAQGKTDSKGRFEFKGLRVGEKYFVAAAWTEYEQGENVVYLEAGPLKSGKNQIRMTDEW